MVKEYLQLFGIFFFSLSLFIIEGEALSIQMMTCNIGHVARF